MQGKRNTIDDILCRIEEEEDCCIFQGNADGKVSWHGKTQKVIDVAGWHYFGPGRYKTICGKVNCIAKGHLKKEGGIIFSQREDSSSALASNVPIQGTLRCPHCKYTISFKICQHHLEHVDIF